MKPILTALALIITLSSNAQVTKPTFLSFSYAKINPGRRADYMNLIKNYSPKITAERIRQGSGVESWFMYELRMPTGASNEYDVVSITTVSDFNLLFDELNPPEGTMEKLLPSISTLTINNIFETYESSRTILRKEVMAPVVDVVPGAKPSRIVRVDYLNGWLDDKGLAVDPGNRLKEYKDLIAKGLISNVKIYKKLLPINASSDVNYVIMYFANDVASIGDGRLDKELAANVNAKISAKGTSSGRIIHSEIWELVEYVDVEKAGR